MPYSMDNMPESMEGAPRQAMEVFVAAFNSAFEKNHVEGAAMAIAMAAVHKAGYKKDEQGHWMSPAGGGLPSKEVIGGAGGGNHSDWIPIFKTGTHTDSAGNEKTWTEAELDTIVQKYQPQDHEAPVVIGHPEHNSPAWGWVEGLRRESNILFAKFKGLVPEFVDMVRKGSFKKRSISLYPDMTLRHVGFLGGMPPAVKGLPDVAFADENSVIIEFGEIGNVIPKSDYIEFGGEGSGNFDHLGRPGEIGGSGEGGGQGKLMPGKLVMLRITKDGKPAVRVQVRGNVGEEGRKRLDALGMEAVTDISNTREKIISDAKELGELRDALLNQGLVERPTQNHNETFFGKEAKRMKWFEWMKGKAAAEGVTIEDAPQSFAEAGNPKSEIPNPKLIAALVDAEVARVVTAKNAEFAETQKTLDAEKARLKAEGERLKKAEGERRKDEIKSFCEGLCKDGKLTPAMMKYGMGMTNFLEAISGIETAYEFCEPKEGKKLTPAEHIKAFMACFKKQIEFGEFAGNDKDIPRGNDKRDAAIRDYQEKNKKDGVEITYRDAVLAVSKEQPELFKTT
mgnify:CR=1 FL=1